MMQIPGKTSSLVYCFALFEPFKAEWHLLYARHSRESGNPVTYKAPKALDPRFRGDDDHDVFFFLQSKLPLDGIKRQDLIRGRVAEWSKQGEAVRKYHNLVASGLKVMSRG